MRVFVDASCGWRNLQRGTKIWIKMGSASFLVICISAVLYLVAFGLALGAMEKRSKVSILLYLFLRVFSTNILSFATV